MVTPRERMLAALAYDRPDRIPVEYHPSPAGVFVHRQRILDLFNRYPPDNPVVFDTVPMPPPTAFDPDGRYHEIRADEWGTTWEFRIFGVQGHPLRYPFPSWQAAADYTFPPLPPIDARVVAAQRERYLVFAGWVSIFEKLHALRPMDEMLMDLASGEPQLMAFLDRMEAYWQQAIERYLAAGVDVIIFGDDWGTQSSTLVSPALFRALYKPRYERLMAPIHAAGRRVLFHSCGVLTPLLDDLFDLGIAILWPQITLCEDLPDLDTRCREAGVTILIHPDRQVLIPLGSPAEIDATIRRYAERYRALGGGGIFHVEMENDAPFENVQALVEAIDRYR